MIYQQAGLIVCNDACLSFGYEYVLPSDGEAFGILTEAESERDYHQIESDHAGLKRYSVWLFKHGKLRRVCHQCQRRGIHGLPRHRGGRRLSATDRLARQERWQQNVSAVDAAFKFFDFRASLPEAAAR